MVSTARIGSAVRVIRLPRALMAWADQNLRKSECRQRPADGQANAWDDRVSAMVRAVSRNNLDPEGSTLRAGQPFSPNLKDSQTPGKVQWLHRMELGRVG